MITLSTSYGKKYKISDTINDLNEKQKEEELTLDTSGPSANYECTQGFFFNGSGQKNKE